MIRPGSLQQEPQGGHDEDRRIWHPAEWKDPSDMFLIRYSPERQTYIRLHNDRSLLSISVKLIEAREGGVLTFPRQGFNDRDIPVGDAILWPSQVTHPHTVTPVKKGKRVSLVVWTSV